MSVVSEKPALTYRDLAKIIAGMSEEQKDANVTVYDDSADEAYPVNTVTRSAVIGADDIIDSDYYVICIST